jgi:hypothetical protein
VFVAMGERSNVEVATESERGLDVDRFGRAFGLGAQT